MIFSTLNSSVQVRIKWGANMINMEKYRCKLFFKDEQFHGNVIDSHWKFENNKIDRSNYILKYLLFEIPRECKAHLNSALIWILRGARNIPPFPNHNYCEDTKTNKQITSSTSISKSIKKPKRLFQNSRITP